jgi:hypothetical protein
MSKTALAPDDYRDLLYMRQGVICRFLPDEIALNNCLRSTIAGTSDVLIAKKGEKIGYKHLQTCKNRWQCPICADRRARQTRKKLMRAVQAESAAGFKIAFVLYTAAHSADEPLDRVRDRVRYAHARLHSGKAWQTLERWSGWDGSVRNWELTYSSSGWHFHSHELGFVRADCDLDELKDRMGARWHDCVSATGSWAKDGIGLNLKAADIEVKDYIAKFGIVAELTQSSQKTARGEGILPFQFADIAVNESGRRTWAAEKYREYASGVRGLQQFCPGGNLRPLFRFIAENPTQDDFDTSIIAGLTLSQWRKVVRSGKRSQLLRVASTGDKGALDALLTAIL